MKQYGLTPTKSEVLREVSLEHFALQKPIISSILIAFGTLFTTLTGGADTLFKACSIMVTFDLITGCIRAKYQNEFTSRGMYWGFIRKGMLLSVVVIAHQADMLLSGGTQNVLRTAFLFWVFAIEGRSILENLAKMDVVTPKFLKDILDRIRQEQGNDKDDKGGK